jgi:hypothetical protein
VDHPCVEKNALCERRFARVNVRGNPDVSGLL